MDENNYEVYYFDGLKAGVTQDTAISLLAGYLKTDVSAAEKMINASNRVIKSQLSKSQADKYFSMLNQVGLKVEIRHSSNNPALDSVNAKPNVMETDGSRRDVAVEFNGQGFEYFKIWIVNIFLSIITLGIYSAWAKVRNKQYFYGNTVIDGSSFVYTAKPLDILKGRAIAVVIFIIFSAVSEIFPIAGLLLTLLFFLIFPWLIVRSLAFNARNSMYRNIRFNFTGSIGNAAKIFLLWPILLLPTLGLILPYLWYKQSDYFVNNSAYGATNFNFNAVPKSYFLIFIIGAGGLLLIGLSIFFLNIIFGEQIMSVLSIPLMIAAYFLFIAYITAALGNLYFNSSALLKHGFSSNLATKQVAWIYFSNSLAILLSLGLMIPWAKVRMARYRISCLTLQVQGSLADFVAAEQEKVSALGEQLGEVFDIDVAVI